MSETRAHDLTEDCWCGPEVVTIEPTLTPNGLYPYADPTAHRYIVSIDDAGDGTKLCRSCGCHRKRHPAHRAATTDNDDEGTGR